MKRPTIVCLFMVFLFAHPVHSEVTFQFLNSLSPPNTWLHLSADTTRDLAFLAGGAGIYSYSYSSPEQPVFLDYSVISECPERQLVSYETYLFVQNVDDISLYSTEDPSDLTFLRAFNVRANMGFLRTDSLLYVVDRDSGLMIWNIIHPEAPMTIYQDDQGIYKVAVEGHLACFNRGTHLDLCDVSDPANPAMISTMEWAGFSGITSVLDLHDGLLTAADYFGQVDVWDVSDPAHPTLLLDHWQTLPGLSSILWFDDIAWYSTYDNPANNWNQRELLVFDFATPDNPQLLCSQTEHNGFGQMMKDNGITLAADGLYTFSITSALDPTQPGRLSEVHDPMENVDAISVQDTLMTVDYDHGGWRLMNIRDLGHPCEVSRIEVFNSAPSVVSNNVLFTQDHEWLKDFSLGTNTNPQLLDSFYVEHGAGVLDVEDSLGVLSCLLTVAILDVSDPSNIEQVGTYVLPDYFDDIAAWIKIKDQYALLGTYTGINVLSIQDPVQPELVTSVHEELTALKRPCVSGNRLYAILGNSDDRELYVFSLDSLPDLLEIAPPLSLPDFSNSINVYGNRLYVTNVEGLYVYDINNINNIRQIGFLAARFASRCCTVSNDTLFVGENYGVFAYQMSDNSDVDDRISAVPPDGFMLLTIYPNPFNASTQVRFSLSKSQIVSFRLFNLLGRQVMGVPEREFTAGNHTITILGTPLASGIYFLKMMDKNNREQSAVKRVTLIK